VFLERERERERKDTDQGRKEHDVAGREESIESKETTLLLLPCSPAGPTAPPLLSRKKQASRHARHYRSSHRPSYRDRIKIARKAAGREINLSIQMSGKGVGVSLCVWTACVIPSCKFMEMRNRMFLLTSTEKISGFEMESRK
jgi:hypothetical protein